MSRETCNLTRPIMLVRFKSTYSLRKLLGENGNKFACDIPLNFLSVKLINLFSRGNLIFATTILKPLKQPLYLLLKHEYIVAVASVALF